MSILGKLMFWKKEPDFGSDLGNTPFPAGDTGMGMPSTPGMPDFGADPLAGSQFSQPSYAQPSAFSQRQSFSQPAQSQDNQLISAKLDAIKALLDSLNQRVANIEKIAYQEEQQQKGRYQW